MPKAKSVSLASIPPVADMRVALAYVFQGRLDEGVKKLNLSSTDKLRKIAKIARDLSKKTCFFCKKDRKKVKDDGKGWEKYQLCGCLEHLTKGYREFYTWHDVQVVANKVANGELPGNIPAYADDCKCGTRFTITVGQVAAAFKSHRTYHRSRRCLECVRKLRLEKQQKEQAAAQAKAPGETPPVASTGEKPTRKGRNRAQRPLKATLGEIAGAHVAAGEGVVPPPQIAQA